MYSPLAVEHISNPRNGGPLAAATHIGVAGEPGEGPFMRISLVIEAGTVWNAAYETYGCAAATACGSLVTTLLIGRTVEQADLIDSVDIIRILGGLPEGKEHCARLAEQATRKALRSPVTGNDCDIREILEQ